MTSEERSAMIAALLEERRGYVVKGDDERVKQVDAQLNVLGHSPKKRARARS